MTTQQVTESSEKPMHLCKDKTQHYISLFLPYSIPLFAFIAFSSLSAYWVQAPYDGWRIYELFILMAFGAYLICNKKINAGLFSAKTNKVMAIILIVIASLVACSSYYAQYSQRAIADAALYFLLASGIYAQAVLFRKNPSIAPKIAAWLAVLPMLSLVFLPIAIYDISQGRPGAWTQSFTNIRMLDDALLPCLFLLWQRPAWLSKNPSKTKLFNNLLTIVIYTISVIYILSFLMHGARAGLLAIGIALICIALVRLKEWCHLLLPINSIIIASICFFIFSNNQVSASGGSALVRTGSSERVEIWQKSINLWQQHPILGTGGNSFLLNPPHMTQGHPHNIAFQLLSEWGIAGFLALLLLIPLIVLIIKNQKILPSFAVASILALAVNAMLSGTLIYPVSQLLALWPLAWIISLLPITNTTPSISNKALPSNPLSINTIFKILVGMAIVAMLTIHGRDIFCNNCMSVDWEGAPRFWDAGRALHLIPYDINKIGKAPDQL